MSITEMPKPQALIKSEQTILYGNTHREQMTSFIVSELSIVLGVLVIVMRVGRGVGTALMLSYTSRSPYPN